MKHEQKISIIAVLAVALSMLVSPALAGKKVKLEELPEVVKEAAAEEVKGIELTKAEVSKKKGKQIYEVEGTADQNKYEIRISEDGEVLKMKVEESDDDDDSDSGHSCPH